MQLMRLAKFTDYGLRMLIYLARAPEGRATTREVALAFGISVNHLVKVAHALGRHGYLVNTRGRRGGLRLARAADEINLGGVVRSMEAGDVPAECFDRAGNQCLLSGGCRLQDAFGEAVESFYRALGKYTLADLDVAPRKLRILFAQE